MYRILLILIVIFSLYTGLVYRYGGGEKEKIPFTPEERAGWVIWQQKNCQSCHQLYGLGGYMGPDLTNTASDKGAEYMRVFIRYGTGRMPDMGLSEQETELLVQFLSRVSTTGRSQISKDQVHWTGTYIIE